MKLNQRVVDKIINEALREDLGEKGDLTTQAIFSKPIRAEAEIISKSSGVVCGLAVAEKVFKILDSKVTVTFSVNEGSEIEEDQIIAKVKGPLQAILGAERTALNFMQHLSGISTLTRKFINEVKSYPVQIFDTRKTTPGLRMLEKYAVKVGGGFNHRFGLFDAVLIKDNHVRAAGGIGAAIRGARSSFASGITIEVEAENLEEVAEALEAEADIILLDNMELETLKKAVKMVDTRAVTEASGGITLKNVADVARTGVDRISIGALTQAAVPLDVSLEIISVQ